MPNDIHNLQIEDELSGTEFSDLVSHGTGADTVNRYLDSTATLHGGSSCTGGSPR